MATINEPFIVLINASGLAVKLKGFCLPPEQQGFDFAKKILDDLKLSHARIKQSGGLPLIFHFAKKGGIIAITEGSIGLFYRHFDKESTGYEDRNSSVYTKRNIDKNNPYAVNPIVIFNSDYYFRPLSGHDYPNRLAHELAHFGDDFTPNMAIFNEIFSTSDAFKSIFERSRKNAIVKKVRDFLIVRHPIGYNQEVFARLFEVYIEAPEKLDESIKKYFKNVFLSHLAGRRRGLVDEIAKANARHSFKEYTA